MCVPSMCVSPGNRRTLAILSMASLCVGIYVCTCANPGRRRGPPDEIWMFKLASSEEWTMWLGKLDHPPRKQQKIPGL